MENSKHVKFLFSGKNVKLTCLRICLIYPCRVTDSFWGFLKQSGPPRRGGGDWGNLPRVPGFRGLPKYYKITWSYWFFGWERAPKKMLPWTQKRSRWPCKQFYTHSSHILLILYPKPFRLKCELIRLRHEEKIPICWHLKFAALLFCKSVQHVAIVRFSIPN